MGQAPQQGVTLADIEKMDVKQRVRFFSDLNPSHLASTNDFIPALVQVMNDIDDSVRFAAAKKATYAMLGLQQVKQQGQSIPISDDQLLALQSELKKSISDPDSQVRGAAMAALIYSDAPNADLERILLSRINQEQGELRFTVLKDMVSAGYQSEMVKHSLIAGLGDNNWRVGAKAVDGIAILTPSEALPKLSQLLTVSGNLSDDQWSALHNIVDAIAAYGPNASPYLPQLEKLLIEPSVNGTLPDRVRAAIETIKNPSQSKPSPTPVLKPVSLLVGAPKFSPTAASQTTPAPAQQPKPMLSPTPPVPVEKLTPFSRFLMILAAILATIIVGTVVFFRRRK